MMQKSKPATLKSSMFKASPKEIRSKANALPLKSMMYAISHALSDPTVKQVAASGNTKRRASVLSRHLSSLDRLVLYLGNSSDIDPNQMYGTITSAAHSYVNLFYSMKPSSRNAYIEEHSSSALSKRIKPENNLLVLPAIMASRRARRSSVHSIIVRNLHAMPLRFLYSKTKAAMRVELLEQAMGIKGARESALAGFSASMKNIEALLDGMADGEMNPASDERAKDMFVNHIVDISESEEMRIAEYISEKLSTSNVSFKIARRIIRK